MKETGIVRRIDELGRVVIPKEIRKTLRLSEGDPVEIYTDRNELILKKYSPINATFEFAKNLVESVYVQTALTVIVCDTDNAVYAKGQGAKDYEKKPIAKSLLNLLKQKRTVINENEEKSIKIVDDIEVNFKTQLIMPVLSQGDLIGGLVLLSQEEIIDAKTIAIASFCVDFLGRNA